MADTQLVPEAPSGVESLIAPWRSVDLGPALRGEILSPSPSLLARSDGAFMLYPARTHSFFGESESGKSWMAFEAARQEIIMGGHVAYFDFEDSPESAVERLRAFGVTDEQIEAHFTYIQPEGAFDELAEILLEDTFAKKGKPSLAIIDALTDAMAHSRLDPRDGTDVTNYYAGLPRWLCNRGAAVCTIDHVTKSTEGRGRWAIGSERKISVLTGVAYMIEAITPFGRGQTGRIKISVAKDRCGHVLQHSGPQGLFAMVELKSEADGSILTSINAPKVYDGSKPFRPTFLMEKISRAVEDNPGISSRSVRSMVSGKNDAKDLALELLVTEGFIRVDLGPNRTRQHHSERPFRDGETSIEDGGFDEDF